MVALRIELSAIWLSAESGQPALRLPGCLTKSGRSDSNRRCRVPKTRGLAATLHPAQVDLGALESPSPGLQPGAKPSQLPVPILMPLLEGRRQRRHRVNVDKASFKQCHAQQKRPAVTRDTGPWRLLGVIPLGHARKRSVTSGFAGSRANSHCRLKSLE